MSEQGPIPSPSPDDPHRAKVSASKIAALGECPSQLVRAEEVNRFTEANGIPSLGELMANARFSKKGTDLHEILASVPIRIDRWGYGKKANIDLILADYEQRNDTKISNQDRGFLRAAIRRRDELIGYFADSLAGDGVKRLMVRQDNYRITDHFYVNSNGEAHERSGLPDILIRATNGKGETRTLILDYKSGYNTPDDTPTNQQLIALGVLDKLENPSTVEVFATLITRENVWENPALVRFDGQKLAGEDLAHFNEVSDAATTLLDSYYSEISKSGSDSPSKEFGEMLDSKAQVGKCCTFCDGKLACGTFRQWMTQQKGILETAKQYIDTIPFKDPKSMKQTDLVDSLVFASQANTFAAAVKRYADEGKAIAAELMTKGKIAIDGIKIEAGRETLEVKTDDQGNPKYTTSEVASILMDMYPNKVKKGELIDRCTGFSSTDLKEYFVETVGAPKSAPQYKEWAKAEFKKGPFHFKQAAPSVKIDKSYAARAIAELEARGAQAKVEAVTIV